jgi:hypothetical protein
MKLAELERHLRRHGCIFYREGGAHTIKERGQTIWKKAREFFGGIQCQIMILKTES